MKNDKLLATSPIGKNGQIVLPAPIRKFFRITTGRNIIGFFMMGNHVELAPVAITRKKIDYTNHELTQMTKLAKERGGRRFKNIQAAKDYLKSL